eukprot:scaffold163785_cov37-Cyclotella_meneghiniana.AAC.3
MTRAKTHQVLAQRLFTQPPGVYLSTTSETLSASSAGRQSCLRPVMRATPDGRDECRDWWS